LYSPSAVTNAAGQVQERYRYDAYGKQAITTATGTTRNKSAVGFSRGFTGYILDEENGLYCARARMYSAGLGRFVGRDPHKTAELTFKEAENARHLRIERFRENLSRPSTLQAFPTERINREINQNTVLLNSSINTGVALAEIPSAADGYIDGMNLYQWYFIPYSVDPTGKWNPACVGCLGGFGLVISVCMLWGGSFTECLASFCFDNPLICSACSCACLIRFVRVVR